MPLVGSGQIGPCSRTTQSMALSPVWTIKYLDLALTRDIGVLMVMPGTVRRDSPYRLLRVSIKLILKGVAVSYQYQIASVDHLHLFILVSLVFFAHSLYSACAREILAANYLPKTALCNTGSNSNI